MTASDWTASRRGIVILGIGASAAAAAVAGVAVLIPLAPPPTDVVGPANYNHHSSSTAAARQFVAMATIGWPLLTAAAVMLLRRLWRPRPGFWSGLVLTLPSIGRAPHDLAAGLTDAALLGLAAGLGAAFAFGFGVAGVVGTATAFVAVLALATGREPDGLARAVAGLAPLGPMLLAVASSQTQVATVDPGAVQAYPWFPAWLAAALAIPGWIVVVRLGAERAGRPVAMLWVGLPLVWLLTATLPGAIGPVDLRAEGETLVAAFAVLDGRQPWAEQSVIRGPWVDAGRALVGMVLLEPSRWGATAGLHLIVLPLWVTGAAALFAWLLEWRWPHAAVATVVAVVLCPVPGSGLILWAPALGALALLLVRATVMRAAALVAILAVQVALVPAAGVAAAAIVVVVALHDSLAGAAPAARRFRRTLLLAIWTVAAAAVAGGVLVAAGDARLLQPVLLGFDTAGPIDLGAVAADAPVATSPFSVLAGVLALIVIAAGAGWAAVARRRPGPRDWVMLAAALFVAAALPGVVGGDALGVLAALAIPAGVVAARFLALVEARVPRPPGVAHPVLTVALLATLVATAVWPSAGQPEPGTSWRPAGFSADPAAIAGRLRPTVIGAGADPRIGYARAGAVDPAVLDGWRLLLEGWVAPGGRVLDLSDRPGLFHWLLGYRPAGRFLHGGLALRRADQEALAAGFERARPEAVILPTVPGADGIPATVRLHRLVPTVLAHYDPVEAFPDGVLYVPRGTDLADPTLHARVVPCDWGDAAGVLAANPAPAMPSGWEARPMSGPETVTFQARLPGADSGVRAELVVALLDDRPIADEVPGGPNIAARRFEMKVQVPRGAGRRVRLAIAAADGSLHPVTAGPEVEFDGETELRGTPAGVVEAREIAVHDGVLQLAPLPVERAARPGVRLELNGGEPGRRYGLGDRPPWSRDRPDAAIRFGSPLGARVVVPLGACPQWWGFGDGPLYLWSEDGRPVPGLSLAWYLAGVR